MRGRVAMRKGLGMKHRLSEHLYARLLGRSSRSLCVEDSPNKVACGEGLDMTRWRGRGMGREVFFWTLKWLSVVLASRFL